MKKSKIIIVIILSTSIILGIGYLIYENIKLHKTIENMGNNVFAIEKQENASSTQTKDKNNEDNIDITQDLLNTSSLFIYGTISKIENNTIYFYTKENKHYYIKNNDKFQYENGRTFERYNFEDIKEKDYIEISNSLTIKIYRNISGWELKKELLEYWTLRPKDYAMVVNIEEIEKINEDEVIATIPLNDIVYSEEFPIIHDEIVKVKVKFTNNTEYHAKANDINDINTLIQNEQHYLSSIELDSSTIDSEYPVVLKYEGTDT